jgi:triacylglycerol lipase
MPINTVILHHGLLGGGMKIGRVSWSSYRGIGRSIAAAGYRVFVSDVHPTAGIPTRAAQLRQWILANRSEMGKEKIVLVTHSLGGLDARYMLTRLEMAEHVDALLTVSTPHRGSAYADFRARQINRLGGFQFAHKIGLDIQAFTDLTLDQCRKFNEEIPDVPSVRYFSISASVPRAGVQIFSRHSWDIVSAAQGPNDGLVSVSSAMWGKHLGTWPVDHLLLINRKYPRRNPNPIKDISPHYIGALETIFQSQS